jgi:hypothetical protein
VAKIKKNAIAISPWDIVTCEVAFGNNGVQLNTTTYPGHTGYLADVLAGISKATLPATKESLERAAIEIKKVPTGHRPVSKEELRRLGLTRDFGDLSSYVFQPELHKIKISRSRPTQLIFYSLSKDWKFDWPGIYPDITLDPAIGTLAVPEFMDNDQTVRTTFVPSGLAVPEQFKYNLRLIASVLNFGVSAGHVIIIVDPIIEKSKQ